MIVSKEILKFIYLKAQENCIVRRNLPGQCSTGRKKSQKITMQINSKTGESIRHPMEINICQLQCKLVHHEYKENTGTSASE